MDCDLFAFTFISIMSFIVTYICFKMLSLKMLELDKKMDSYLSINERVTSQSEHIKNLEHSHKTLVEIVRNAQRIGQQILDEKSIKAKKK